MMQVVYGTRFLKSAKSLPEPKQKRLADMISIAISNPFDTRLHSKKLSGVLAGLFSFRIGRPYRVIYQFLDTHTLQLLDVGRRKDIYQ